MKSFFRVLIFAGAGGLLGLGYYSLFGCTGGCPITSSPWLTMGYFSVIGGLLAPLFPVKPGGR